MALGVFSVNTSAGVAFIAGASLGLAALAFVRGTAIVRRLLVRGGIVIAVVLLQAIVLAYLPNAAFVLTSIEKIPLWLVVVAAAIECCGLAVAAYAAALYVRSALEPTTSLRGVLAVLSIVAAVGPVIIMVAFHDPRLRSSAELLSRLPLGVVAISVLGVVLSLGYWVGDAFARGQLIWLRVGVISRFAIGLAVLLPIFFIVMTNSLYRHGGISSVSGCRKYDALLTAQTDVFRLSEHCEQVEDKTVVPLERITPQLRPLPDGFLVRKVHFKPFRRILRGVKAIVIVRGLAADSLREVDFSAAPGDASSLTKSNFEGLENAQWTMSAAGEGVTFTYTPPMPGPIRKLLTPFFGLATVGAWVVLLGSMLFVTALGIVWGVILDRLKHRFQQRSP